MRLSSTALALALVLASASAFAGCYLGGDPPAPPSQVGPAPLRRLSNAEYLNALHDLFPSEAPVLPPLPSDAVGSGFENSAEAQQPSDVRIARYEAIANVYATALTKDTAAVRTILGCDWATPSEASACTQTFIETSGRRIFRRPITTDERDRFALRFHAWETSVDFEAAVRLTLSAMLQSPQFLYRAEPIDITPGIATAPVEPYAMASRLSFFLWESVPDDLLLEAAAKNELASEPQIRAQAERMLNDDRAKRVLWSFHRQWLGLDRVLTDEQLYRTPEIDPGWTAASALSAHEESRRFVENVLRGGGSFRDLLLSRRAWVDRETARIYGLPQTGDPIGFSEVELPPERAGILTRIAFLAGTSHRGGTSPPIRGNAIQLRMLCQLPSSPPPGADLSMPVATPEQGPQTTRMLFETRTSPKPCRGCHVSLNDFGYGFEGFDAAGAHRTTEVGLTIDAHGSIRGSDVDRAFDGAVDLSTAFAGSRMVHRCATQNWLRYALGRAPETTEIPLLDTLAARFATDGDVRALLIGIATSETFRLRTMGQLTR